MNALHVFDSLIDIVLSVDAEMNLRYANGPASELMEVSVKRLSSGKPLSQWIDFVTDEFSPEKFRAITDPTPYIEVEFKMPTGKAGWAQVSVQKAPKNLVSQASELQASEELWLIFVRDVSLEKTLHSKYKTELDQKEAVIADLRAAREKLEEYSKNLEKMVESRTMQLSEANRFLKAVLDSLGQGILVFGKDGKLKPLHSKVGQEIFEKPLTDQPVAEVLALQGLDLEEFNRWMETLFSEVLDFTDLAPLGPAHYAHSRGLNIDLSYNPMRTEKGALDAVVMVATDKTQEVLARKEAERERNLAKMVMRVAGHRDQFRAFALEARKLFSEMLNADEQLFLNQGQQFAAWLHTLKGGAASFSIDEVAKLCHQAEDMLAKQDSFLEIKRYIESAKNYFEQFLLEREPLFGKLSAASGSRVAEIPLWTLQKWRKVLEQAARNMNFASVGSLKKELEDDFIYVPVGSCFAHINSLLEDLSQSLGKEVEPLKIVGADLRVIPEMWSGLFASFVHAFRNSIDHGIESRQERFDAGKEKAGTISLTFKVESVAGKKTWLISIGDDGKGIDPERIKQKLIKMNLDSTDKSSEQLLQSIFMDGFSTQDQASMLSGRGAGLSAVLLEAQKLGGTAWITSELGKGSCLWVKVPEPESIQEANTDLKKVS